MTDRLLQFLGEQTAVLGAINTSIHDGSIRRLMLERASKAHASWSERAASERRVLLQRLLSRISVQPDQLLLHLDPGRLAAFLLDRHDAADSSDDHGEPIILTTPVMLTRSKHEMRLVIRGQRPAPSPDPTLVRLIVKAQGLWTKLLHGNMQLGEVAARESLSSSYFTRVMRNALLAPDIIAAILEGRQPASLTTFKLMADSRLPLDWADQRRVLGFG